MAFGDDAAIQLTVDGERVEIVVTATGMTGLTVYRVTAGGNINVRGAEDTTPNGVDLWFGADFEAPQGKLITYGADITDGVTNFEVTPVTTVEPVDYGGDYIMPVGNPSLAMNVLVEAGGMGALQRDIVQDVKPVLNRASPVVVSFNRRFFSATINFLTLEADDAERFKLLIEYPVIMFVSRLGYGFSDPVYLALGRVREERTSPLGAEPSRRWITEVNRVDRPPAEYPYVVVGATWQERENVPNTWQTALDNYENWYTYAGFA